MFFGGPMGGLNGDPDYPDEEQFYGDGGDYSRYKKRNFVKDKWYYHHNVYVEIIYQTEKAYLVKDSTGQYWVPKALIHFSKEHATKQYAKFEVKYL